MGYIGSIYGLYWGYMAVILGLYIGLYWDTGKENGNCRLGFRAYSPP